MADGKIIIETELVTDEAKGKLEDLNDTIAKGGADIDDDLTNKVNKLNAAWDTTISKLEIQQAKIEEYKNTIVNAEAKKNEEIAKTSQLIKNSELSIEKLNAAQDITLTKIEEENRKLIENQNIVKSLENYKKQNAGKISPAAYEATNNLIIKTKELIKQAELNVGSLNAKWELTNEKINSQNMKIAGYTERISSAEDRKNEKIKQTQLLLGGAEANAQKLKVALEGTGNSAKRLNDDMQKSTNNTSKMDGQVNNVDKSMKSTSRSATNMTDTLSKGVGKVVKYGLALFSIRSIYSMLSRMANTWLNSNDEGAQQTKANIEMISNSLSSLIAPVIQTIVGWTMTLMGYVNALTKAFFGVELFTSKAAKNIGGSGVKSMAGGVKKVNKELKKTLAGFDEVNILTKDAADNMDDMGSAGGGGGGVNKLPTPVLPTPDISGVLKVIEKVSQAWDKVWNSDLVQSFLNMVTVLFTEFTKGVISIGGNIWDNILKVWDAAGPDIMRALDNTSQFYTLMFTDIANSAAKWIPIIVDNMNDIVDMVFNTLTPAFELIATVWADVTGFMLESWEKYGSSIIDNIGEFVNNIITFFKDLWANLIDPIVGPMLEMFSEVWNEHLKYVVQDIIDFVFEITEKLLELWNDVLFPFVQKFMNKFGEPLRKIFTMLWSVIGGILASLAANFSNVFGNIKQILRGLIDFVGGVFSGQWGRAWQGIQDIVAGVFGGMVSIVKSPLNLIIGIINGFLRGLNKIKIPSWVPGIGGSGVNIGEIPYLAEGGVINRPTMAMVGEYAGARGNPEIVTPENKMREAMADVLSQFEGVTGGEQQIVVKLVVDGKTLAEVVHKEEKKMGLATNGGY